jgi:hypothetical protein
MGGVSSYGDVCGSLVHLLTHYLYGVAARSNSLFVVTTVRSRQWVHKARKPRIRLTRGHRDRVRAGAVPDFPNIVSNEAVLV